MTSVFPFSGSCDTIIGHVPVAQSDSVFDSESKGCGFESRRARHEKCFIQALFLFSIDAWHSVLGIIWGQFDADLPLIAYEKVSS